MDSTKKLIPTEELRKSCIFEPTEDMYEFAKAVGSSMKDTELWTCWIGDISTAYKNKPLLTESCHWKKFRDSHYGRFESPDWFNKDKDHDAIDLAIDNTIRKNSNFFREFPITYIKKYDKYKEKGLFNGKPCMVGESVQKLKKVDKKIVTKFDIYTDGEVYDIRRAIGYKNLLSVHIKNYTIVLSKIYIQSDDPQIADNISVKMFV